jgi:hypothetical protein
MKRVFSAMLVLAISVFGVSCASTDGGNAQRGAVVGGILGALAGQAVGRNTAGTVIGAAGGALAGAIVGNAADQEAYNHRLYSRSPHTVYSGNVQEVPPGKWVVVPGRWSGGKWVPAHRVWVPVNP